ncbi:hypothetical protein BVIET440_230024 [Burkholderia vietnamiensis]
MPRLRSRVRDSSPAPDFSGSVLNGKALLVQDNAGVAQLVERNLAKVEVASSRLVSRSRYRGSKASPFI